MAVKIVNYHIGKDDQNRNYDYSGKPGLGTLALVAPVQIDDWRIHDDVDLDTVPTSPTEEEITPLYGLRSIRGPNIATNTISAAHHQSTGGFMINYPGLRDGGTFDFEANFNPNQISWQDMDHDQGFVGKSIMESPIFLHEKYANVGAKSQGLPMLQMIVMPASMEHLWYMRGFIAMLGPVTYEMEDIVKATISFKISGRPFLATPKAPVDGTPLIVRNKLGENTETVEWYNTAHGFSFEELRQSEIYPAYWLGNAPVA